MKDRLQKIISAHGAASRRAAEKMIAEGRIAVNGITASLGDSADPETDEITIDGAPLKKQDEAIYIALNKPKGYITTVKDDRGRPTVMELVSDCGCRVYPIGRLDADSQGLILLTNDGELANKLCHPSGDKEKRYIVTVRGDGERALETLNGPMEIDGYTIRPPKVSLLSVQEQRARLRITIHEGRNRQIRRMCSIAGMTVTRLRRISEGSLQLGTLKPGQWRYLLPEEIEALKNNFR